MVRVKLSYFDRYSLRVSSTYKESALLPANFVLRKSRPLPFFLPISTRPPPAPANEKADAGKGGGGDGKSDLLRPEPEAPTGEVCE